MDAPVPKENRLWLVTCALVTLGIASLAWLIGFGFGASAGKREMETRAVMLGYATIEKDAQGHPAFRYFTTDEIIEKWKLRRKR